jgi:hypothetical protein
MDLTRLSQKERKLTDSISAIDDFGDQWISRDLKVQWSSREQLATNDCFETVGYQIGQRNKTPGFFVSMSIMVPVLVYSTRPYCYYGLIFDFFNATNVLTLHFQQKRDAVHPGRTLAVLSNHLHSNMCYLNVRNCLNT